jgi:hypothetical protein
LLHAYCHIRGPPGRVRDGPRVYAAHLSVSVLHMQGHEAAGPGLHSVDPLLPAAGHVKVLQAMFVMFLALVLIILPVYHVLGSWSSSGRYMQENSYLR